MLGLGEFFRFSFTPTQVASSVATAGVDAWGKRAIFAVVDADAAGGSGASRRKASSGNGQGDFDN